MNHRKIQEVDERLSSFYSDVELDSVSMPIYNSLASGKSHYTDEVLIAEGGMKKVYSVFDSRADRKVALAKPHENLNDKNIEAFLKEARLTARLDHPNIIKIHEVGLDEEGTPFFTMDLKTGHTLAEYIKSEKGNLQERLSIFLKICDAISYAHSKGVLHLDLKPENIQIGEFGEVMICDWGLSIIHKNKSFKSDFDIGTELYTNATQNNKIKGTPGFMAPEQVQNKDMSERTDIFSLGIILHFMLTKEIPYSGSVKEIVRQTVSVPNQAPSLNSLDLKIPVSLDAVFLKATEIPEEERYKSVKQLSGEIRAYMEGFSTLAENAGISKKLLLLVKRNKTIFSILTTSLFIIVILLTQYINDIKMEKLRVIEESKKVKAINDQYVKDLTEQSLEVSENLNISIHQVPFAKTLELLNKVLDIDENAQPARAEKANLLFVMQRYNEAYELIDDNSPLKEICDYARKLDYKNGVNNKDFKAIFDKLMDTQINPKVINRFLFYDFKVNLRNTRDRMYFVKRVLKYLNPECDPAKITYSSQSLTLTLEGKIKIVHNEDFNNPIRFLLPTSVVLIDTEINSFSPFKRLGLNEIDIRGSKIEKLPELIYPIRNYTKIKLRKDQFRHYKKLPKNLTLDVYPK